MPKKPKFTREELLAEAYRIAESQGIGEVSSRSLAKNLHCSIQPVYTHFPTMSELRQETFRYACRQFTREILACRSDTDPFQWTAACTVNLARNRPNLFKLIFLSEGFTSRSLPETMWEILGNQRMFGRIMDTYGLDRKECENITLRMELFLLGIGTMICSNHLAFTDQEITELIDKMVSDLVGGAKDQPDISPFF